MPHINSKEAETLLAGFQDYEEAINNYEYWDWKINKELKLIQKKNLCLLYKTKTNATRSNRRSNPLSQKSRIRANKRHKTLGQIIKN